MDFSKLLTKIADNQYNGDRGLFSKDTGIPYSTLTEYMNGKKKDPKLSLLRKLKNVNTSMFFNDGYGFETLDNGSMNENAGINTHDSLSEPQYIYGDLKPQDLPMDAIPFFNLPVSAGKSILDNIGSKNFDGYLYNLPNIPKTEYCLPVYGTSMGNEVKEGAYIGVRRLDSWERYINTEHKYLVITKDDRMIKYLEPDPENEEIIWCISPNYPRFKLYKADVLEIHRVTFVLNP